MIVIVVVVIVVLVVVVVVVVVMVVVVVVVVVVTVSKSSSSGNSSSNSGSCSCGGIVVLGLTCFSLIFHLVYEHIHGADENENARGDHSHQQGAGDNIVLSLPWWTLFTYIHFRFSFIQKHIHTFILHIHIYSLT